MVWLTTTRNNKKLKKKFLPSWSLFLGEQRNNKQEEKVKTFSMFDNITSKDLRKSTEVGMMSGWGWDS